MLLTSGLSVQFKFYFKVKIYLICGLPKVLFLDLTLKKLYLNSLQELFVFRGVPAQLSSKALAS